MTGAEIRVSAAPGERRTALIEDGRLAEAWIERPARPDGVGDVHLGRVRAVVPALSGAFVDLGEGAEGFLPEAEAARPAVPIGRAVTEGQAIPVRVTRAAQGGKGPRLTALLDPPEPATGAAPRLLRRVLRDPRKIRCPPALGTLDDLFGDLGQRAMDGHASSSCQVRPSRSISAVAAAGPQPPAT